MLLVRPMTIREYLDLKPSATVPGLPSSVLFHQILREIDVIHHMCELVHRVVPALHTQPLEHKLFEVLGKIRLIQQAVAEVPRVRLDKDVPPIKATKEADQGIQLVGDL